MNPRAIVIFYNGEEVSEYVLSRLVSELIGSGVVENAENISASLLNCSDLSNAVVDKATAQKTTIKFDKEDPVEQALIFISKYFEKSIDEPVRFTINLSEALKSHYATPQLETACRIIWDTTKFSRTMLYKYKMNETLIKTIKTVYHLQYK